MLEELKKQVYEANMLLPAYHLVTFTWGNVSGIDREKGLFVIKPSGVPYEELKPEDMVVIDLQGNKVEGDMNPSSDTPTHAELYRRFKDIGGVVHTHSRWATAMAQAEMDLPCFGTTHADHFYGSVPCTRHLSAGEIQSDYERNTGKVIIETFEYLKIDPVAVPAVLVCKHGPFTWGSTPQKAVENALVLEECAYMAFISKTLTDNQVSPAPKALQDKHYLRKHGANAYYGQSKENSGD